MEQGGGNVPVIGRLGETWRSVTRFLERRALARATRAIPRTLRFIGSGGRAPDAGARGAPPLSPALVLGVAMDEALLAMAMTPTRFPRRADYLRVAAELAGARDLYDRRGWLADPAAYHRPPPALTERDVGLERGWAMGLPYERIVFESGFEPLPDEPGGERWRAYEQNRRACATVLRHSEKAPWIVAVHGFCMGYPFMDFVGLQVAALHRRLGFNVAMPVLPLHGPRKVTRISGEPFLSFDLMNTVHGLAQSVWDTRRLLSWIRDQGGTSISLYGVSLGAYVVTLLDGLGGGARSVVAGIPVVDIPRLFHEHSPLHIRARSIEHRILGGAAEEVFRVVSPLALAPGAAPERRAIFAGHGDRLAFPEQAEALWEHWGQPRIAWYPGNHVGYLWSRQVTRFLVESLGPDVPGHTEAPVEAL